MLRNQKLKMNNCWRVFIISFLFLSCGTQKDQGIKLDSHELADFEGHPILFYNTENLFDTIDSPDVNDEEYTPTSEKNWNTERYFDKINKLTKTISFPENHQPLLIGLCEVENTKVINDLIKAENLKNSKLKFVHFDSPDQRGIDVALIYDEERFYPLHKQKIPVYLIDHEARPTRDILYVKGLIKGNFELHVFVNHWPSRHGGEETSRPKRIRAAESLKHVIDSIIEIDPKANLIIMGDLNDHPTDMAVETTLGAKNPATDSNALLLNLQYEAHLNGKGSYSYKGEWGVLDHLIVSSALLRGQNTLKIKEQSSFILYEDFLLYKNSAGVASPSRTYGGNNYYGGYSDHLPVYMYLTRVK